MKKVMFGLMAAALSLGLAAPSFAAVPQVGTTSHVVKVQQTTQAPAKKKVAKKKSSKKAASKKAKKKSTQG
jgi:hypothetical protein